MEEIYTIPEVAKYLKLSKSKVYDLVKRERITFIKIGRNVRIKESDLDDWLEKQTRPSSSD
jgi:excisionase family DNA binding protein